VLAAAGAGIAWLVRAVARSQEPPARVTGAFGETALARLEDPLALGALEPACSTHFHPFLEDFVRKALAAGDPVAVATAGGKLVGLAWNDREASIGTVLTSDTATANGLLRWVEAKDFFSEHRHRRHDGEPWYNVHETYAVLALEPVPEVSYDTGLVARMTEGDGPAVEALCAAVFEVGASRWLRAQLDQGDVAFVAKIDGKVVGFGLATACGDHGRLHTLAVDPAHRDAGIGRELVRARLTALSRLGVRRALVEIASWNVASLHLARQAGFQDVGELYVETTSPARAKRTIVRR
jgi:ribosomal protein S18 acetylase RimI-like enzyme